VATTEREEAMAKRGEVTAERGKEVTAERGRC